MSNKRAGTFGIHIGWHTTILNGNTRRPAKEPANERHIHIIAGLFDGSRNKACSRFHENWELRTTQSTYDAFNFSANFFSSFASFGEITNMQYGCREFSL